MSAFPVSVRADRSAPPGRWLWLVKWLLLIPHYVVLAVLWVAFAALTAVAYVVVLFTGRYPAAIHGFNTGVLRWTWRVGFYGYTVLGTDRYPPFTLAERPDYPAGLTVAPPTRLPRWLPLVAWLLALPHLLIGAALAGTVWQTDSAGDGYTAALSVASAVLLVAAVALLFTGRYPPGLYDLLAGIARWWLRVVAYVTLLTGAYPPFRLDQGAREPEPGPTPEPWSGPAPGGRGSAGRVVSLVAGVLLFLVGGGLAAAGGATLAVNADREDGYVSTSTVRLDSRTAAITAEGLRLDASGRWALDLIGVDQARLTVTSDRPVFLGVADEADVDRWLGGTGHDELVRPATGDGPDLRRSGGPAGGVPAPAGERFWVASASGSGEVTLDWSLTEGTYAIVLANVDGTTGVAADVRAGANLPSLAPVGFGLLGGGLLLALAGLALIYLGAAGLGAAPPPGPPAPPPPAPVAPAPARPTPARV